MRRWFARAPSEDHEGRAARSREDAEALEHMENGRSPKHVDIEEWVRRQVWAAARISRFWDRRIVCRTRPYRCGHRYVRTHMSTFLQVPNAHPDDAFGGKRTSRDGWFRART